MLWGVRWPQYSFLPPISSDKKKKEEREPEAARGVELLCNYNMVLKKQIPSPSNLSQETEKRGGSGEEG